MCNKLKRFAVDVLASWRAFAKDAGGVLGEWFVHASLFIALSKAAQAFGIGH